MKIAVIGTAGRRDDRYLYDIAMYWNLYDHVLGAIREYTDKPFHAVSGGAALVGWTVIATAILLMDNVGAGNLREQAEREQSLYEARLNELASERDAQILMTSAAQQRFATALEQISAMQSRLLASGQRGGGSCIRGGFPRRPSIFGNVLYSSFRFLSEKWTRPLQARPIAYAALDFLPFACASIASAAKPA